MSDISGNRKGVTRFPDKAARPKSRTERDTKLRPDNRIIIREYDHIIFISAMLLVIFGLVMVFSASSYAAMHTDAGMFSFLISQSVAAGLGFVGMIFAATFNYKMVARFSVPLYALAIFLLVLVLVMGEEGGGATRWLVLFGFNFQPSEVAKVAVIVMLAVFISKDTNRVNTIRGIIGCGFIIGLPVVLITIGGNLSTVIIICAIGFMIVFLASPYFWRFLVVAGSGAAAVALYIIFGEGFRVARISAWMDPFAYPTDVGFQTIQSLYAVASGGPFGLGFGNSIQKRYFLPEAQNDFIFAIIVEELGLFGASIVLFLFGVLVWRGMRVAMNSRSTLGCLMATGIVTMIAVQVIINVGVVTNTIPNTGIPLPFISFGGTALAVMMTAVGVLLNISRYPKTKS